MFHGWQKISAGVDMTAGFFGQVGIDWLFGALFWANVVAYTEFIGGIALVLGIFVRYVGVLLAIAMAVAVFVVHWSNGFSIGNGGYEFAMLLGLGALALVFTGAGRYSLARGMKMCEHCEGSN